MSEKSVSISIVTFNDEKCIGKLLDSISENVKRVDYHIYVIDNGSKDNTATIVKNKMNNVTFIENKKNIGFGAGHNKILELINTKYHVYTNPDIVINTDIISDMVDYLDNQNDIGVITPKVLYPDGRLQILPKKNPRLIYLMSRRIRLKRLKKYREEYEMLKMNPEKAYDIEFATGCFMFLRTDILKKVGGFDERYFLYFEDADLTRSIRCYSRAEYNPKFVVYHDWDRAGSKKIKYFIIQILSMLKYIKKWKRT